MEYPVMEFNRGWTDVAVSFHSGTQLPLEDGIQMRGVLLCRGGGVSLYSCGGFLARSTKDHGEEVWISVTRRGGVQGQEGGDDGWQ